MTRGSVSMSSLLRAPRYGGRALLRAPPDGGRAHLGPPCQFRLEQPPDLFVVDAARVQPLYRRRHDALGGAQLVGGFLAARRGRDERAGAVAELDDALVLELAGGLGGGVGDGDRR